MAGRLKEIVDYAKAKSYFKNLTVSRLNMRLHTNVEDFRENTSDDPELEKKLIQATKEVLRVDHLDIP